MPRATADAAPEPDPNGTKKKHACATCADAPHAPRKSPFEGLSTLGRRSRPTQLAPVQRSISEGARIGLVGTAAGDLAFAVKDLELRGPMPVLFQRVYSSDRGEDSGLGAGWSFLFDDRITVEGDEAVLRTGTGGASAFRRVGRGRRFALKEDEPALHRSFELTDGGRITEEAAGMTRTYVYVGGVYRLSRIADPRGNSIDIAFDRRGLVSRIAAGGGASLKLVWSSGGGAPRLLSVSDSTGRRVSFTLEGGRLRSVTDAAGAVWVYGYAGGRLALARDPLGRVLLRAVYDARGRASEAGDDAGSYRFDYDGAPGRVSRRTVVTDPEGARAVFAHTAWGAVASVDDDEGRLMAAEYDAARRPLRLSDHLGEETAYDYDARQGPPRQSSDAGGEMSDASDAAARASSDAAPAGYAETRDARGRLTSLKSASGRHSVSFEYDDAGRETAVTYPGAGRFETAYDRAGRKVAERMPSGLAYAYLYDARGQVVMRRDNRGGSLKIERDASGAVAAFSSGGRWVRATRDEAGRVVALVNSEGRRRLFSYDARGGLTGYVDAGGARRGFEYDPRGRLRRVTEADGASLRLVYDRAGRLVSAVREREPSAAAALFMKAGYEPPAPPAAPQSGFGCLGDVGSEGWFEGDTWGQTYGTGCWDMLGGFGGDGGGDWWLYYPGPESCLQCGARQKQICQNDWDAKYYRALGTDAAATAGCALITAGTLALVCAAAAGFHAYTQVMAANAEYNSCVLKIPEQCITYCR
jgi:YD repeat-containing protein